MIPKNIWILWYEGIENAPFVVKKCVDSWILKNPDWNIKLLNSSNISAYINVDHYFDNLPIEKRSNLVRLQLLEKYGGVWVDATTFCINPLDDWIDNVISSGFFAFSNSRGGRLLSNWFLASEPNNYLIHEWKSIYIDFFKKNGLSTTSKKQDLLKKALGKYLNKKGATKYWFNPLITKFLGIYPYFIMHYSFEKLITENEMCKHIWDQTPKISADGPHSIQRRGLFSPVTNSFIQELTKKEINLYKLTWKYDQSKYTEDTLLNYLLNVHDNNSP